MDWKKAFEESDDQLTGANKENYDLKQQLRRAERDRYEAVEVAESRQQQLVAAVAKAKKNDEWSQSTINTLRQQLGEAEERERKVDLGSHANQDEFDRLRKAYHHLLTEREEKDRFIELLKEKGRALLEERAKLEERANAAQAQKDHGRQPGLSSETAMLRRKLGDALKANAKLQASVGDPRKHKDDEDDDEEPGYQRPVKKPRVGTKTTTPLNAATGMTSPPPTVLSPSPPPIVSSPPRPQPTRKTAARPIKPPIILSSPSPQSARHTTAKPIKPQSKAKGSNVQSLASRPKIGQDTPLPARNSIHEEIQAAQPPKVASQQRLSQTPASTSPPTDRHISTSIVTDYELSELQSQNSNFKPSPQTQGRAKRSSNATYVDLESEDEILGEPTPFKFIAFCTYGEHEQFYTSEDLRGTIPDLWKLVEHVEEIWVSQYGDCWPEILGSHKNEGLGCCITQKCRKKRTNWGRGRDKGLFACVDCVRGGLPCFTYTYNGDDEGEFRMLPLLDSDRMLAVVKGFETRYWVNDGIKLNLPEDEMDYSDS